MLTAVAAGGHPAVAGLLGVGTAGLAGAVVAMTWSLHVRQIRLAEQLARRQLMVTADAGLAHPAMANGAGPANGPGNGARPANGAGRADSAGRANAQGPVNSTRPADSNGGAAGGPVKLVIDGPDTVVTGEQARFRVPPLASRKVVSWAAGGGSLAQGPDPAHPEDLLLIADRPGELMVTVWVREGMTERRATKPVTAVPDSVVTPPLTLRPFLNAWGLVVVAVLIIGFAGALAALGTLTSGDFIALAAPLAALLAVTAVARGTADPDGQRPPGPDGPVSSPERRPGR
jgi:hypothetical protein